MTTTERPASWKFPPITVEQLRERRCASGHLLPSDPTYLLQRDGEMFCPTCPASYRRPPGATVCINNHDLTEPGALGPRNRCRACARNRQVQYDERKRELSKLVKSVLTPVSPEPMGEYPTTGPDYFGVPIPPIEVRMNAACGPDTAYLYNRSARYEKKESIRARHTKAARICAECPVFDACAQWFRDQPKNTDTVAAVTMQRVRPA